MKMKMEYIPILIWIALSFLLFFYDSLYIILLYAFSLVVMGIFNFHRGGYLSSCLSSLIIVMPLSLHHARLKPIYGLSVTLIFMCGLCIAAIANFLVHYLLEKHSKD
jgi:phosphotransferase system  glucose/maltose/N-acetylglucosamine-specific IIC component